MLGVRTGPAAPSETPIEGHASQRHPRWGCDSPREGSSGAALWFLRLQSTQRSGSKNGDVASVTNINHQKPGTSAAEGTVQLQTGPAAAGVPSHPLSSISRLPWEKHQHATSGKKAGCYLHVYTEAPGLAETQHGGQNTDRPKASAGRHGCCHTRHRGLVSRPRAGQGGVTRAELRVQGQDSPSVPSVTARGHENVTAAQGTWQRPR